MKKILSIFTIVLVMFMVLALIIPAVYAGVAIDVNGTRAGVTGRLNLTGGPTVTRTGNETVSIPIVDSTLIAAGAANGGATSMLSSTTAVPTGFAYINMQITTADPAFSAKTLADGVSGQFLTIHVYSGSQTTTVTPVTSYGFSVLTFNAVDDQVILLWVGTDGWTEWDSDSVTVTP